MWQDVMNVMYSDVRTIVNSVLSTEPASTAGTRGTAYTYQDFVLTADTLTISSYRDLPIFIDEADRYQQSYFRQMEIADYQGKKLSEFLESEVLAQSASWTDFGQGDLDNTLTDDTTRITVSVTNIDNIVRAIKRKVYRNNGVELASEKGFFIVWRPADYELLEEFAMASGFHEADLALKNGVPVGMHYMGVDHFLSNDHAANHLFAGVKKVGKDLGILRSTFGKVKFLENPANSSGDLSGLGIVSRLDYGFSFPSAGPANQALIQLGIDINVV